MPWTANILKIERDGDPGQLYITFELTNGIFRTQGGKTLAPEAIDSFIQSQIDRADRIDEYLAAPTISTGERTKIIPVKPPIIEPPEPDHELEAFNAAYEAYLPLYRAVSQGLIEKDAKEYVDALEAVKSAFKPDYAGLLR
jgi:hypothetical protein